MIITGFEYGKDGVRPQPRGSSGDVAPVLAYVGKRDQLVPFGPRAAYKDLDDELDRETIGGSIGVEN